LLHCRSWRATAIPAHIATVTILTHLFRLYRKLIADNSTPMKSRRGSAVQWTRGENEFAERRPSPGTPGHAVKELLNIAAERRRFMQRIFVPAMTILPLYTLLLYSFVQL
jgi:hypothetical protein